MSTQGMWFVEGPHPSQPPALRWRAEFIPKGHDRYDAGIAWGRTEDVARRLAMLRARLKNYKSGRAFILRSAIEQSQERKP